ncbi:hypothetical protein, partial [Brevibacillus panacihumi]|uniref:hypothetical protein n=1 Tax=Brevibacillus panacihumi TaxID=497735 RepID=UPI003D1CE368
GALAAETVFRLFRSSLVKIPKAIRWFSPFSSTDFFCSPPLLLWDSQGGSDKTAAILRLYFSLRSPLFPV